MKTQTQNVTGKERELLRLIAGSEYQDGGDPVNHRVWLDYIVDSKMWGGVLTSLQRKGLVGVQIVPMNQSQNASAGITDSTVWLTAAGAAAS